MQTQPKLHPNTRREIRRLLDTMWTCSDRIGRASLLAALGSPGDVLADKIPDDAARTYLDRLTKGVAA